jgi:hypothetical protein
MTCVFPAIVNDIKSVQKNRGDNHTKYLQKLVVKDESMEIDVPEEVLKAIRKKSPKKCGQFEEEDGLNEQLNGVENSSCGVVGVEGVDEVGKGVEDELEPHWSTAADIVHSSSTEPLAPLPPPRRNSNKQPQVKNTTAPQDRPVISRGKSTAASKLRTPISPDSVTIQSDSPPPSTSVF